jgi:signal transduction histidine kinase
MCEPTTIAFLGTQMTALGGAANSVALINAGNFVRTSASLISFASNVGMNVANTYVQGQAQKRAADIQKAKFNEQQIRYAREREEQAIKDLQEKNELKRKYAAMASKQTVDMAATGATLDSGSFNNILLASRRAFKDDLEALGFRSLESQMKSFDLSEDARIAKEAVDPLPEVLETTVTGIDRISKLTSEFNNPPKKKS